MNTPTVSVVMVVCNVDRFLAESIKSILGQSLREFEFIIVDFGSTDKSRAIISEYEAKDDRIKFQTVPHCGLAEARNASCSFARGRYVAIMDADDVSAPQRLAWQVEFLEQYPEVSVLGGAAEWIDKNGRALATFGNPIWDREIRAALLEFCPLWQPSVLMRREAFVDVGGYRPPFAPAEDYDLWLRMSEHFQLGNLKQVVLKYRIHPHQVSIRKQKQQTLGRLAALASASLRKMGCGIRSTGSKRSLPQSWPDWASLKRGSSASSFLRADDGYGTCVWQVSTPPPSMQRLKFYSLICSTLSDGKSPSCT
jgi:glycosyltransferase involved in cell wall biosynthesis